MGDLLRLAQPLSSADLRRINPNARLRDGRSLVIRDRPMITLSIIGAVENPGILRVPKGTTLHQLLNQIRLSDNADVSNLKDRRRLRDHDVIEIPFGHTSETPARSSSKK